MHTRYKHTKEVFGGWWWVVTGLWALVTSADTIIQHLAGPGVQRWWQGTWVAAKVGWQIRIIGVLLITVIFIFEVSLRRRKKMEDDLQRALEQPSGPELMLECDTVHHPNVIVVKNIKGGTAHSVVIEEFKNHRYACAKHEIPFIPEGKEEFYEPAIASMVSGVSLSGVQRVMVFITSPYRTNPPSLREDEKVFIPVSVKYWDGGAKEFCSEFEIQSDFSAKVVKTVLKKRCARLRA